MLIVSVSEDGCGGYQKSSAVAAVSDTGRQRWLTQAAMDHVVV